MGGSQAVAKHLRLHRRNSSGSQDGSQDGSHDGSRDGAAPPAKSTGSSWDAASGTSGADAGAFSTSDVEAAPGAAPPRKKQYFGLLRSKQFWIIFAHGQILSWALTATNTLTTELGNYGASFPALQSLFVYNCLFLVFVPWTIYKQGWRGFGRMLLRDSWKFFILSFADVQGNYFVVKAYQYTNILSAALLDNFAIVVVVVLSFTLLKVRYHWSQLLGVAVSIGGMALLIVSDHLSGHDYKAANPVKGDLFVLLAAACYGVSNTLEEYLVSKRPVYEVLGQMGMWGQIIIGVQCAIFERDSVRNAHWSGAVGGFLTGYTLAMLLIYTTTPILFRMSSAAFYNLSLLTSDFWALLIGIRVFGYRVFWLYPVGFVFVVIGVVCYCAAPMTQFGEALKPWLGADQEMGVSGVGTARTQIEAAAAHEDAAHDHEHHGGLFEGNALGDDSPEPTASAGRHAF